MELAKKANFEDTLSFVLALMAGALKGVPDDRQAMAQSWLMSVKGEIEAEWLLPAAKHFMRGESPFFPTPGEFLSRAKEIRRYELHTKGILEATKQREKALDEARLKALQEKYPSMDAGEFRAIFQDTAKALLGKRKELPQGEKLELADAEQERKIRDQVREMRG